MKLAVQSELRVVSADVKVRLRPCPRVPLPRKELGVGLLILGERVDVLACDHLSLASVLAVVVVAEALRSAQVVGTSISRQADHFRDSESRVHSWRAKY